MSPRRRRAADRRISAGERRLPANRTRTANKTPTTIKMQINDQEYEETASGDGQYDAFMRAIRNIYKKQLGRDFPMLINYSVSIPPGGRTDAFVQTYITWEYRGETFKTRGLDADQTEAAIKATMKMLNRIENMQTHTNGTVSHSETEAPADPTETKEKK